MEWYDDVPHIGYDINGKKIFKPLTKTLDRVLNNVDDVALVKLCMTLLNTKQTLF
jgi:ribosome biogenesis protein ERB1